MTKRGKTKYSQGEISDYTGFDVGDRFDDESDVRAYFQAAQLRDLFMDGELEFDQDLLDDMVEVVIENRWHLKPLVPERSPDAFTGGW